jgi:hypothetical protein
MIRKHIYVNSSNLNYIPEIDGDDDFQSVYNYPAHEYVKTSAYEWGRIKTDSLYIHFIMGHIRDRNCPWCGYGVDLKSLNKDNPSDPFHRLNFCMECRNCGSRGPVNSIIASSIITNDDEDMLRSIMESVYIQRKNWDETEEFNAKDGE